MASNEEAVTFKFKVDGVTQVTDASNQMSAALGKIPAAVTATKTGLDDVSKSADESKKKIESAKHSVTLLTSALVSAVPQLGPLNAGLSQMAAAAGGISNTLGISAGAAAAAGGLLYGLKLFYEYTQEATLAIQQFDEEAEKSLKLRQEMAVLAVQEKIAYEDRRALAARILAGEGSLQDLRAAAMLSAKGEISLTQEQIAQLRSMAEAQQEASAAALSDAKDREAIRIAEIGLIEKQRAAAEKLRAEESRSREAFTGLIGGLAGSGEALKITGTSMFTEESAQAEINDREVQYHQNMLDKMLAADEKYQQDRIAFQERYTQMGIDIAASGTASVISDAAKGKKIQLGLLAETIGNQLIARGTADLLMSAAMAANILFPPGVASAGALAAAGAAELAFGTGLTAAGGGASGTSAQKTSAAASNNFTPTPTRDQYSQTPQSGKHEYTIIVNALNPTAETGRLIRDSLSQAVAQDRSNKLTSDMIGP